MRVELFPGKHLFVDEHRIETLTAAKLYLDQADEGAVGGSLAPDQRLRLHAHSADGLHWHCYPWREHHVARLLAFSRDSVRWCGSGDVRSLSGKMVALQFSFSPEDKLYSYTLGGVS